MSVGWFCDVSGCSQGTDSTASKTAHSQPEKKRKKNIAFDPVEIDKKNSINFI